MVRYSHVGMWGGVSTGASPTMRCDIPGISLVLTDVRDWYRLSSPLVVEIGLDHFLFPAAVDGVWDGGAQVRLHGLRDQDLKDASHTSLKRITRNHTVSQFLHLSILIDSVKPSTQHTRPTVADPTTPEFFYNQMYALWTRYDDIFSLPSGLPPAYNFDHYISLLPATTSVNVHPYRYPHLQKTEIEWGDVKGWVIRPSMSLFLSPVIHVKK